MTDIELDVNNEIEAVEKVNELPPTEEETQPPLHEQPPPQTKPAPPLKNNSKIEQMKDTYINCEKCGKHMLLKSYRYKHERTCQGPLESKPIKSIKPKAVPIAKPQKVEYYEENQQPREENQQPQLQQNNIIANTPPPRRMQPAPPPNPLQNIAQHYQLLQNEYLRQKQEKYNALNKGIFGSRGKKR